MGRFYAYLLMFMASMLGVVLADNILALFIFWELTSLSSYLLIGYKHKYESARRAAQQALLVTGSGGLAMLLGMVMLGQVAGSYELSEILLKPEILASPYADAILILLFLGALTKSAQWRFHFWLPNAMEAPTPVSAYLHSATMVKAGIYLLARISPVFAEHPYWQPVLVTLGLITALTAGILAFKSRDLKRLLAYSTLLALATLTLLLGIGGSKAALSAMIYLIAHSLYKGALFMVAGSIDHEAKSRDIHWLSGLARQMPLSFVAATLAAISMAGLPPALGFIAKELSYTSLLTLPSLTLIAIAVMILANGMLFAVSAILVIKVFLGKTPADRDPVHEAPWQMSLWPLLLAGLSIFLGLLPKFLDEIGYEGAKSIYPAAKLSHLHLFPESFNTPLLLSLITIGLGILLAFIWRPFHRWLEREADSIERGWLNCGPAKWYQWGLQDLERLSLWQLKTLQSGNIRRDLLTIFGFSFTLTLVSLWRANPSFRLDFSGLRIYDFILVFLMLAGAFTAMRARTRLTAITALGAVGSSVALTFITYAAPDLAITQFMIETLLVIIIALVLIRLPSFSTDDLSPTPKRIRDAIIAGMGGLSICLSMLAI
ncbi:MAG: proton-conducting transporter membrane subunit [Deinococcales bacterium]